MICTFLGHRNTSSTVKNDIKITIENLIKENVREFYVGNNGNFDFLVQQALAEISTTQNISYAIVLSRPNEAALSNNQNATIFPEGLENALPRFAIAKRNEWMLKKSKIVIAYTKSHFSNCYKWLEKAEKRGLKIINIAK